VGAPEVPVRVAVRANTGAGREVTRSLRKIRAEARGARTDLKRTSGAAGQLLSTFKRFSGLGGLLGGFLAVNELRTAVTAFSDFESSMAEARAVTGATNSQFIELTATARELGRTTKFSATEAASGIVFLGRAGFETTEIVSAMPSVLDLAAAATLDLGRAADITSNIMSAFAVPALEATRIADALAAVAANANTDVSQMGEAMKFVGPVARALGVSMEDSAAAIGILSNAGLQASLAGTGLRRILSSLAKAAPKVTRTLTDLGLKMEDLNPQTNSLIDIIRRLAEADIDATAAFEAFGDRGAPAILALTSMVPQLERLTDVVNSSEGAAGRMAETMRNTLRGATLELKSVIESVRIEFGTALAPALRETSVLLKEWFDSGSDGARKFGEAFGQGLLAVVKILLALSENIDLVIGGLKVFLAYRVATVLAGWVTAMNAATVATHSFSAALLANPIGVWVAAAVAAYAVLDTAINRWADSSEQAIERTVASSQRLLATLDRAVSLIERGSLASQQAEYDALSESIFDLGVEQAAAAEETQRLRDQLARQVQESGLAAKMFAGTNRLIEESVKLEGELGAEIRVATLAQADLSKAIVEGGTAQTEAAIKAEELRKNLEAVAEGVDQVETAYAKLERRVEASQRIVDLMERTGISAKQAALVVSVLMSEGNTAREAQVLDLVRALELAQKAAAALAGELDLTISNALTQTLGGEGAGFNVPVDDLEAYEHNADLIGDHNQRIRNLQSQINQETRTWVQLGNLVAESIGGIDSGLGRMLQSVVRIVQAFQLIQQEGSKAQRALSGAQFGGALGGLTGSSAAAGLGSLGGFLGPLLSASKFAGVYGAAIGVAVGLIGDMFARTAQTFADGSTEGGRLAAQIHEGSGRLAEQTQGIIDSITGTVNGILDSINGTFSSFSTFAVQIRDDSGGIRVWVNNQVRVFGEDVQGAIDFAVTEIFRQSEVSGVSDVVSGALNSFVGSTVQELEATLSDALTIDNLGLTQFEIDLSSRVRELGRLLDRAIFEFGAGAEQVLTGPGGLVSTLRDAYNQAFGIEQDQGELTRQRILAVQAQIAIAEAQLIVLRQQLLVQQAEVEGRAAGVQAQAVATEAMLELSALGARGIGAFAHTMGAAGVVAAISAESIARALAGVDAALAALSDFDFSPAAINAAVAAAAAAARGISGGGRAGPLGGLSEADIQRELDLLQALADGNTALVREMEEHDRWLGLIARGYSEEQATRAITLQGLIDANAELERFNDQLRDLADRTRDLLSPGGFQGQIDRLRGQFEGLIQEIFNTLAGATGTPIAIQDLIRQWLAGDLSLELLLERLAQYSETIADVTALQDGLTRALELMGRAMLASLSPTLAARQARDDLARDLDDLVRNMEALGVSWEELGIVARDVTLRVVGSAIDFLADALSGIKDPEARARAEEALLKMRQIEFQLRFTLMELELAHARAMLSAQGLMTDELAALFDLADSLARDVLANWEEILAGLADSTSGLADQAGQLEDVMSRLASISGAIGQAGQIESALRGLEDLIQAAQELLSGGGLPVEDFDALLASIELARRAVKAQIQQIASDFLAGIIETGLRNRIENAETAEARLAAEQRLFEFQTRRLELERAFQLAQIALIEAQLTAFGAMTDEIAGWIDLARELLSEPLPAFTAEVNSTLDAFRALRDELTLGSLSNLSGGEQLTEAQGRVDALMARIAANPADQAAIGALPDALRDLVQAASAFTGGAGPLYDRIFAQVQAIIAQMLGEAPAGATSPNNLAFFPTPPPNSSVGSTIGSLPATVTLLSDIRDSLARQETELSEIKEELKETGAELADYHLDEQTREAQRRQRDGSEEEDRAAMRRTATTRKRIA